MARLSGARGPAVFLIGVALQAVVFVGRWADAVDTSALYYNAKAICSSTSPTVPNRVVVWVFSSSGPTVLSSYLTMTGVNGETHSFTHAVTTDDEMVCDLANKGGGIIEPSMPHSAMVSRIRSCGQVLSLRSLDTADLDSAITCYRTNTENPPSGDPTDSTNTEFWATGDTQKDPVNVFWQWPEDLGGVDTKYIAAYFLVGFVFDGVVPGTYQLRPHYITQGVDTLGWSSPLSGCLYGSDWFVSSNPDPQLLLLGEFYFQDRIAGPCSFGMNSITQRTPITEDNALKWWFDLPVSGGGADCTAAPTVTNGYAGTLETSFCESVPDGFICPVICDTGFAKVGQLRCVDGSWSSDFACVEEGTVCPLPSAANVEGFAGLENLPSGVYPAADQMCDYSSLDGAVCRFRCDSANSWGSGRLRCDSGTWKKEDSDASCLDSALDATPGGPTFDSIENMGNGAIRLHWTPPSQDVMAESAIFRFDFTVTPAGELDCPSLYSSEPRVTGHYCTGGDPAVMTKYVLQVAAVNSAGVGELSAPIQLTCPALVASTDAHKFIVSDCSDVEHDGTCTVQCSSDYAGTPEEWTCSGELSGAWPSCRRLVGCDAPTGINLAATPACVEGAVISDGGYTAAEDGGGDCTPACISGYYSPTAALNCFNGTLTPDTFSCKASCQPPNNDNGLAITCAAGGMCTVTCDAGYAPTTASFSCEDEPDVADGLSCVGIPCPVPDVMFLADPPCDGLAPGAIEVDAGATCSPQCIAGYYPSQSSIQCLLGTMTPVFKCLELPCSAPSGIDNQATVSCEEGSSVDSGGYCTPVCAAGYEPSETMLNCSLGSLEPSTFSCIPLGCTAPVVENDDPSGACTQSTIGHGGNCTAQCTDNYFPSVDTLSCSLGQLTPSTFTCIGDPCPAPVGIVNSADPSCGEGDEVDSGSNCTCSCAPGYLPDRESISCSTGKMTPPFFACLPAPCKSPDISFAPDVSCLEGDDLEHGEVCTLVCVDGYTPSVATVTCLLGGYDPTDFSCEPDPCPAPTDVELAPAVTCEQGSFVDHGADCTPVCDAGYAPNISKLECSAGQLDPPTFACFPAPCASPVVVNAPEDSCVGGSVDDGGVCTTQCSPGYYPSVESLNCSFGALNPATFECLPSPCDALSVANAVSPSCAQGSSVPSGGECTTQCHVGYTSTVPTLTCDAGSLTPATFSCTPNSCPVPTGIEFAMPQVCAEDAVEIAHGGTCTPQCEQPNYEPDQAALSCSLGELSPSIFTCVPALCDPPTGIEHAADPACVGGRVGSGSTCTTACASGWIPTIAELNCSFGVLNGTFACEPPNCAVPVVPGASDPCAEAAPGAEIGQGGTCTPQCDAEYTVSEALLTCVDGVFTPSTSFVCTKELYGYLELTTGGATTAMVREATRSLVIEAISGLQVSASATSASVGPNAWRANYTVVASAGAMDDIVTDLELLVASGTGPIGDNLYPFLEDEGWNGATYGAGMLVTAFVYDGIQAATPAPTPPPTKSPTMVDAPTFSPTFRPGDCPLPDVDNALSPPCAEGGTLNNGGTCTPQCAAFYEPSVSSLTCVVDAMVPTTFTCDPISCDVPTGIVNSANACGLDELGNAITSVAHDDTCIASCDIGYAPSLESLTCSYGTLDPDTFTCVEVPCSLPDMGSASSEPPCPEAYLSGDGQTYVIDHGVTCNVACISGYAPSEAQLTCVGGVLTPETSTCGPAGCEISVTNAADSPCTGLSSSLLHGETCYTACQQGYAPTEDSLQCTYGVLTPRSFECELMQCSVPVVDNALSPTCEGFDEATTEYLGTCVTQCEEGYVPSTEEIVCTEGVASPSDTYACQPKSCQAPALDTIENNASRACDENWQDGIIPHYAFCTALCPSINGKQLVPTVDMFQCVLGELTPASTFSCYLGHCDIRVDITNAASPPCVGHSAGPLEAGEVCTAQCLDGFRPTATELTCNMGGDYAASSGFLVDGFFDCYEVVDGEFYMAVEEGFGNVSSDEFPNQVKESLVALLGIYSHDVDAFTLDVLERRRLHEASYQVRGSDDHVRLQEIDGAAPRRLAVYSFRVFYDILVSDPSAVSATQMRDAITALFDSTSTEFATFGDSVRSLSGEVTVIDIADAQSGLQTSGTGGQLEQTGTDAAGLGGGGSGEGAIMAIGITATVLLAVGGTFFASRSGFGANRGKEGHDEEGGGDKQPKKPKGGVHKMAPGETGDDGAQEEEETVHGLLYCSKKPMKALPPGAEPPAVMKASKPSFSSSQRSFASMKTTAASFASPSLPSSLYFTNGSVESSATKDGMNVSRGDLVGGSTGGLFGDDLDYPESPGFKMLSEFLQAHQAGRQASKAPSVISDATNWNDDITKMQDKIWPKDGHISVAIYPDGKVQTSGANGAVSPSGSQAPSVRDGFWAIPGTPDPHADGPPAAVFSVPAPTIVTMPTVSSRAPTADGRSRSIMGTSLTSDGTNWGTPGAISTSPVGSGSYPPPLVAPTPNPAASPCASILGTSQSRAASSNMLTPPRPTETSMLSTGFSWGASPPKQGRGSPTPTLQPPLSPAPSTPLGMPRDMGSASPSTVTFGAGLGTSGAGPGSFGTAGFGVDPMGSSQAFGQGFHPSQPSFATSGFGTTGFGAPGASFATSGAFHSAPSVPSGPAFGQTFSGGFAGGAGGGCSCSPLTNGFTPGATVGGCGGFYGSAGSLGGINPSAASTGFSNGSGSFGSFGSHGSDFGASKGFATTSGFDFATPTGNIGADFGNTSGIYTPGGRFGAGAPQQAFNPYSTVSGVSPGMGSIGLGAQNPFGDLPGSVPSDGSVRDDAGAMRTGGRRSWLLRDDEDEDGI